MQNNENQDANNISYYLALRDFLAVYPALAILFPQAARKRALEMRHSQERTLEEIAEWACLPIAFVRLALNPEWPSLLETTLAMKMPQADG